VLATLLNNLKVQERQNRVCTTVAIAIVAETCSPFTVLPGLMNEYRVPELNVQNGVLKSLSFMFEYIGEMGKDYVYAVAPLLEDALMDRQVIPRLSLLLLPYRSLWDRFDYEKCCQYMARLFFKLYVITHTHNDKCNMDEFIPDCWLSLQTAIILSISTRCICLHVVAPQFSCT